MQPCCSTMKNQIKIQTLKVGELSSNCYVASKNGKCFIVDPGDEAENIIKAIGKNKLDLILLTHGHFDHVLAVEPLHEKFPQVPIYMGEDDEDLLKELSEQNRYSTKELKDIKVAIKHISSGSKIIFEGEKIKVFETPGHSFGSVCYLIGDNLFTGDTLFYHTIGRTDFWTSDPLSMRNTLAKLAKLPKKIKVYPGHGRETTIKEELTNGYLARM